jgi:hypothetical protein
VVVGNCLAYLISINRLPLSGVVQILTVMMTYVFFFIIIFLLLQFSNWNIGMNQSLSEERTRAAILEAVSEKEIELERIKALHSEKYLGLIGELRKFEEGAKKMEALAIESANEVGKAADEVQRLQRSLDLLESNTEEDMLKVLAKHRAKIALADEQIEGNLFEIEFLLTLMTASQIDVYNKYKATLDGSGQRSDEYDV